MHTLWHWKASAQPSTSHLPYSAAPVDSCYSHDKERQLEFCQGGSYRGEHERWWSSVIDGLAKGLDGYFQNLYGVQTLHINYSSVSWYWNSVPARSQVHVQWLCVSCPPSTRRHGALWAVSEEAKAHPARHSMQVRPGDMLIFPGFFVRMIPAPLLVVPDGTWVEVMRVSRIETLDRDVRSLNTWQQFYFLVAPGSGIWYNVGRSLRLSSSRQNLGCAAAARDGFDSIQLGSSFRGYSSELIDCRGSHHAQQLPPKVWVAACPPPHISLLVGIPEPFFSPALHVDRTVDRGGESSRHNRPDHPRPSNCYCSKARHYLNCEAEGRRRDARGNRGQSACCRAEFAIFRPLSELSGGNCRARPRACTVSSTFHRAGHHQGHGRVRG